MAIAIGKPGIEEAIEGPSSVDSIRLMWWKQYVNPMINHSNMDFFGSPGGSPTGVATPAVAESGYDYNETWRRNTDDFAPAPRPALPVDPDGGSYSTSYIDSFLTRDPTYLSDEALAMGMLDGKITQEDFIGMSKAAARGVISQITSRMHYVLDF